MTLGDEYRHKASELRVLAAQEPEWNRKVELTGLSLRYRRLAEQADRNSRSDGAPDPFTH